MLLLILLTCRLGHALDAYKDTTSFAKPSIRSHKLLLVPVVKVLVSSSMKSEVIVRVGQGGLSWRKRKRVVADCWRNATEHAEEVETFATVGWARCC